MTGSLEPRRLASEPTTASNSSGDDPRLIRALEHYLEAAEAGEPPDRDAFLSCHPEIASRLAQCLEGMDAIRGGVSGPGELGEESGLTTDAELFHAPTPPIQLGDYLLLRELGRGGMGVVYEARQLSLGRRVALKLLPFSSTLDPRQLRRFRTEARAAAWLQHDHIVPVFAFGSGQGLPFYAMRLIEGRSLSTLIAQWRDGVVDGGEGATARGDAIAGYVASLGIQAAEALDYAHGQGVLHRDIKPANLLVDDGGHLWITDFGLARFRERESVTRSGDLIGTIRYMSPEQALGKHSEVDHRTDVYSLGATLYELLTRAPLFEASDTRELVNRVLLDAPRPPRSLDPSIPRDLETIVLKALAKEPGERYATAADLADDLRRYRADLPIRARRPSATERLTCWARRHRAAVLTAAILLAVALIGQSATILMLTNEERRSRDHAFQASENSQQLFEFADALYRQVEGRVGTDPEDSEADRRLLGTSLGIFERFTRQADRDPRHDSLVTSALIRAGDIHLRLGHHPEASLCYHRALVHLDPRPTPGNLTEDRGDDLAHTLNRLGQVELLTGNPHRAFEHFSRAVTVQEGWIGRRGGDEGRLDLVSYLIDVGRFSGVSSLAVQADRALSRALDLADAMAARRSTSDALPGTPEEAEALKRLIRGRLLRSDRHFSDAIDQYRAALDLYRRLSAAHPDRAEFPQRASEAAFQLAWFLATCSESSVRDEGEAVTLVQHVLEDQPDDPGLLSQAGVFFMQVDRYEEAERAMRAALASAPDRADLYNNLAWLLATRPEPRRPDPAEATRLAEEAIKLAPGVGIYWNTLGVAHYRSGRLKEAIASLETSMQLSDGGNGFDWFVTALALWKLGDRDSAAVLYDKAVDWMDLLPARDPTLHRFREEADLAFDA
ncbi:Serine/threonine-protein kinase PknH [Tautonia plasticadhaerens]|uniref:Serine/threonine-protein kinase PknH n=2 Tax=Tautonia plasticadhaerens TaxID=2527974 RepID=A0A518H8B5_9BACT|nr:Serine/threonine-protein kinase PknH [Tautonia plasticadhaerens]